MAWQNFSANLCPPNKRVVDYLHWEKLFLAANICEQDYKKWLEFSTIHHKLITNKFCAEIAHVPVPLKYTQPKQTRPRRLLLPGFGGAGKSHFWKLAFFRELYPLQNCHTGSSSSSNLTTFTHISGKEAAVCCTLEHIFIAVKRKQQTPYTRRNDFPFALCVITVLRKLRFKRGGGEEGST